MIRTPRDTGQFSQPVETLLQAGEPRWDAIEFDVHCARCEYNLRTLTRPICPECGLEFEWPVVLDRARHRSELCFEYGWRTHPVRSLLVTLSWCFRPRTLWQKVSIHDSVQTRPLWVFLLISVIASVLFLHVGAWGLSRSMTRVNSFMGPATRTNMVQTLSRASYQLDRLAIWPLTGDARYFYLPIGFVMSLGAMMLLLSGLHQTLRRHRIRQAQILRIVAYNAAPFGAICSLALWILAALLPFQLFRGPVPILPQERLVYLTPPPRFWGVSTNVSLQGQDYLTIALTGAGCLAAFALLLGLALHRHLRIAQPWFIAAVASFVSMLFSYSVLLAAGMWITGMWW